MTTSTALHTMKLPFLLTMGDAAGIGPEIIVKAFQHGALNGAEGRPDTLVVAEPAVMLRAARLLRARDDVPDCPMAVVEQPADLANVPAGCLPLLRPAGLSLEAGRALAHLPFGAIDARNGQAAAACIRSAVAWSRQGQAAGLVTAPIHKEALAAAGEPYPGHTELLAAEAHPGGQPADVRMMLANPSLKTVLVTVHCSLREALAQLDFEAVLSTVRIAHRSAALWGQPRPRIAVAGLNPHAGEGGLFGDEEIRFIAPAVAAARAEGIDASGPHAPDTVFMRARQGEFDLVVSMIHDHGLIAVKYLGLDDGVNVTLGLPFIRTSPDHGTAFDRAGTGRADPSSLIAALQMARRLRG